MTRRAVWARVSVPALLAGMGLAPATAVAGPPANVVATVDRPRLIDEASGPAGTPWAHCAILLESGKGESAPRQLSSLCIVDGQPVVAAIGAAAPKAGAIAVESGPASRLRILVGRPGGVDQIEVDAPGAPPRAAVLVEDERLAPHALDDRPDLDGDGTPDLVQATYQGLSAWRRGADGGFAALRTAAVPSRASVLGEILWVTGESFEVPVPPAPLRWTTPTNVAGHRLRTVRAPLGPAGGGEICTAWIDTGKPLRVADSVFLSGDPPRLAALVAPSDKLSIFGNLSLLVAPLVCDPTARGRAPTLLTKTEFDIHFGPIRLEARDVTGDGKLDLLVFGHQGLLSNKLRVSVFPGTADGGFSDQSLDLVRGDADPVTVRWDRDVDGDGRLDMVVLESARVLLLRGAASPHPRDVPLDAGKAQAIPLPKGASALWITDLLDLDGDGRVEALIEAEPVKSDKERKTFEVRVGDRASKGDEVSRLLVVHF